MALTLRLKDHELEELEKIRHALQRADNSKTIKDMIYSYMKMREEIATLKLDYSKALGDLYEIKNAVNAVNESRINLENAETRLQNLAGNKKVVSTTPSEEVQEKTAFLPAMHMIDKMRDVGMSEKDIDNILKFGKDDWRSSK